MQRDRRPIPKLLLPAVAIAMTCVWTGIARALPPPDDIPEEVLRNQPIWGGRSPLDNTALSPSEYEELRATLIEAQATRPRVSPKLQRLILLLKLRKLLRAITPF
ncbi:hypothetical protein [Synechococcus sp. PCC 7336]|uniref:hypothetical protein n=1 Tax=Synechococcus sp. PCC 7336 TaxID=195250 RepID=UPI00034635DF|nr:hypothetical protein [Synechococcus sp. PCC 7336]